jgi:beta-carotene 3-hydroxylase
MSTFATIVIVVAAFAAMEVFAALAHRCVMHRGGWAWHRSHHELPRARFEGNDLYPLVFAALTVAALAVGVNVDGFAVLVPVGAGITAYGVAYLLVHDVLVHERLGSTPALQRVARPWRDAHAVHHRLGRAPYGFLVPVTPRRWRAASTVAEPARSLRRRPPASVRTAPAPDA